LFMEEFAQGPLGGARALNPSVNHKAVPTGPAPEGFTADNSPTRRQKVFNQSIPQPNGGGDDLSRKATAACRRSLNLALHPAAAYSGWCVNVTALSVGSFLCHRIGEFIASSYALYKTIQAPLTVR
jgi:hypothetical protein